MKKKIVLSIFVLFLVLILLTGCSNNKNAENISQNEIKNEDINSEEAISKPYKWIIEPNIEADDIIDLEGRKEVSLIKKGKQYNFINNDQGKELLRQDFFEYAILANGEMYIWQEGEEHYKVNEDYTLEISNYAGDYSPNIVYYNTDRNELFTQNQMYLVVSKNEELLENYKKIHGTNLECFVEVTPTNFVDDEFDKYAEFSESDLGKYGYYNKENLEIQIEPIYDRAFNYYENYSAVKKDGKAGFIDLEGKEIFPFEFEETRSFDQGRAWVKFDGKWGVIELVK